MKLPLSQLLVGENPPAGMDWAVIGLWVVKFRKTAEPCDPPIEVTSEAPGLWRIAEGRHRFVAALIAGRTHIDADVIRNEYASESFANNPTPPINNDPPLEVYAEPVGGPGFQQRTCRSTPVNATA